MRKTEKVTNNQRDGRTFYIGSTRYDVETENDEKYAVRMACEITERTMTANVHILRTPDTDVNMYWPSVCFSDEDII